MTGFNNLYICLFSSMTYCKYCSIAELVVNIDMSLGDVSVYLPFGVNKIKMCQSL